MSAIVEDGKEKSNHSHLNVSYDRFFDDNIIFKSFFSPGSRKITNLLNHTHYLPTRILFTLFNSSNISIEYPYKTNRLRGESK